MALDPVTLAAEIIGTLDATFPIPPLDLASVAARADFADALAEALAIRINADVSGGGGGGGPLYSDNIVPTGAINGVNKVFTLPTTPNPTASVMLFLNGALLKQGTDWTYSAPSGTPTITLAGGFAAPLSGDTLVAFYRR